MSMMETVEMFAVVMKTMQASLPGYYEQLYVQEEELRAAVDTVEYYVATTALYT